MTDDEPDDNDEWEWDGFIDLPPPKVIGTYTMVLQAKYDALRTELAAEIALADQLADTLEDEGYYHTPAQLAHAARRSSTPET